MSLNFIWECLKCKVFGTQQLPLVTRKKKHPNIKYVCQHFDITIDTESTFGNFGIKWSMNVKVIVNYKENESSKILINKNFNLWSTEYQNYLIFDNIVIHGIISENEGLFPTIGNEVQQSIECKEEKKEKKGLDMMKVGDIFFDGTNFIYNFLPEDQTFVESEFSDKEKYKENLITYKKQKKEFNEKSNKDKHNIYKNNDIIEKIFNDFNYDLIEKILQKYDFKVKKEEIIENELSRIICENFEDNEIFYERYSPFYLEIKSNIPKIETLNFMIIGFQGVGKSVLVNALLKSDLAEIGNGIGPKTNEIKEYSYPINDPAIKIYDTFGLESECLDRNLSQINNKIEEAYKDYSIEPGKAPNCILYCIKNGCNDYKFEEGEINFIKELNKLYGDDNLIIVFTQSINSKAKTRERKNRLKQELNNNNIEIIELIASNYDLEIGEEIITINSFGLDNLINTMKNKYKIILKKYIKHMIQNKLKEIYMFDISKNSKEIIEKLENKDFENTYNEEFKYIFRKLYGDLKIDFEDLDKIITEESKNFIENKIFEENKEKLVKEFKRIYNKDKNVNIDDNDKNDSNNNIIINDNNANNYNNIDNDDNDKNDSNNNIIINDNDYNNIDNDDNDKNDSNNNIIINDNIINNYNYDNDNYINNENYENDDNIGLLDNQLMLDTINEYFRKKFEEYIEKIIFGNVSILVFEKLKKIICEKIYEIIDDEEIEEAVNKTIDDIFEKYE